MFTIFAIYNVTLLKCLVKCLIAVVYLLPYLLNVWGGGGGSEYNVKSPSPQKKDFRVKIWSCNYKIKVKFVSRPVQ